MYVYAYMAVYVIQDENEIGCFVLNGQREFLMFLNYSILRES